MKRFKDFFKNWGGPDTAIALLVVLTICTVSLCYNTYSRDDHSENALKTYSCYCMMHKPHCPNNIQDPCEYQFYVEDTSIAVYNNDRYVGCVPLQGALDSLITADNE